MADSSFSALPDDLNRAFGSTVSAFGAAREIRRLAEIENLPEGAAGERLATRVAEWAATMIRCLETRSDFYDPLELEIHTVAADFCAHEAAGQFALAVRRLFIQFCGVRLPPPGSTAESQKVVVEPETVRETWPILSQHLRRLPMPEMQLVNQMQVEAAKAWGRRRRAGTSENIHAPSAKYILCAGCRFRSATGVGRTGPRRDSDGRLAHQ